MQLPNALTESAALLRHRLSELDSEREQILVALRALDGLTNGAVLSPAAKPGQRRRRAAPATASKPATTARTRRQASSPAGRSRRSGGGTQADRFLKLVTDNPGITVAQAAGKMGMSRPNALFSVASRLAKEGTVTKQGTGYRAA